MSLLDEEAGEKEYACLQCILAKQSNVQYFVWCTQWYQVIHTFRVSLARTLCCYESWFEKTVAS